MQTLTSPLLVVLAVSVTLWALLILAFAALVQV
jgi:hypothetical protein